MIKDIYYQRGFPDPILENDYVLSLARPFVPGVRRVAHIDETGGEARTYAVDEDIIVKVQRPQQMRLSTSLEREAFFLKQLETQGINVSVPKVLGYGKDGTVEYTVMTRMPGAAVSRSELTAEQKKSVLFELGTQIARIHKVDMQPFYCSGLFPFTDKTAEDIRDRFIYMFERTLGWMRIDMSQSQKDEAIGKAAELAGQIVRRSVALTVPCHANPGPVHTFVFGGRFSGLIDFGDAYISHPVFDIRRWPIADRPYIVEGYKNETQTDGNFDFTYNISNEIDAIFDNLLKPATCAFH